jgi:hypothetical protein
MLKVYLLNGKPFLPIEKGRELAEDSIRDLVGQKFSLKDYADKIYDEETVEIMGIPLYKRDLVTKEILGETDYRVIESDECNFFIDNEMDSWMEELDEGYFNLGDIVNTETKYAFEYECVETEKDWTDSELELLSRLNDEITAEMLEGE